MLPKDLTGKYQSSVSSRQSPVVSLQSSVSSHQSPVSSLQLIARLAGILRVQFCRCMTGWDGIACQ